MGAGEFKHNSESEGEMRRIRKKIRVTRTQWDFESGGDVSEDGIIVDAFQKRLYCEERGRGKVRWTLLRRVLDGGQSARWGGSD